VTEFIKRVKTKSAMKGKFVCSTCHCITYTNLHFMISFIRINELTYMISLIFLVLFRKHELLHILVDIRNGLHEIKDKTKNNR